MNSKRQLREAYFLAACLLLGTVLRCWHLNRESVEHFDEGVYASVLWYDGVFGDSYPARDFYAPSLLPWMIETAALVPGVGRYAPFVPSLVFGIASIAVFWWIARSWFGSAAGMFIAVVVAMSDFHIQYSRMALTDVPALFWIVLSVGIGISAVSHQDFRRAVLAGFCCGIAWWTKYTGWLPLAIVGSGTTVWWLWQGRKHSSALKTFGVLLVIALSTLVTFAPWWWHLQDVGGYSAIHANHTSYMVGGAANILQIWREHLTEQITFQLWQDGLFGAISLGVGMLSAAWFRWNAAECSTWNTRANDSLGEKSAGGFSPFLLALRFAAGTIALTILSLRIRSSLMLPCIALGGFSGMFLWPVLHRAWIRRTSNDRSPTTPGALPLTAGDLETAPTSDPSLALCTMLCWFVGLLVVTPLYSPYARLFFPLLASIWLAAAAAISWWLESNLSVARRGSAAVAREKKQVVGQGLVASMALGAVLASFFQFNADMELKLIPASETFFVTGYDDRRSIDEAAVTIANACVAAARGEFSGVGAPMIPIGQTIFPDDIRRALAAKAEAGTDRQGMAIDGSGMATDGTGTESGVDIVPAMTQQERMSENLVIYAYGEPALLMHLNQAGVTAAPVSYLNLRTANAEGSPLPTFVVIGPNAKRSAGFWEERLTHAGRLEEVIEVPYQPGTATLLDLFSVKWLRQHKEATTQQFEVYRVR